MDEKLKVYEKKKNQKEKKRKVSFIIYVEDHNVNYRNEILDIAKYVIQDIFWLSSALCI
jgi:hypothetical protein